MVSATLEENTFPKCRLFGPSVVIKIGNDTSFGAEGLRSVVNVAKNGHS